MWKDSQPMEWWVYLILGIVAFLMIALGAAALVFRISAKPKYGKHTFQTVKLERKEPISSASVAN
jgi:hypothetical protein